MTPLLRVGVMPRYRGELRAYLGELQEVCPGADEAGVTLPGTGFQQRGVRVPLPVPPASAPVRCEAGGGGRNRGCVVSCRWR